MFSANCLRYSFLYFHLSFYSFECWLKFLTNYCQPTVMKVAPSWGALQRNTPRKVKKMMIIIFTMDMTRTIKDLNNADVNGDDGSRNWWKVFQNQIFKLDLWKCIKVPVGEWYIDEFVRILSFLPFCRHFIPQTRALIHTLHSVWMIY